MLQPHIVKYIQAISSNGLKVLHIVWRICTAVLVWLTSNKQHFCTKTACIKLQAYQYETNRKEKSVRTAIIIMYKQKKNFRIKCKYHYEMTLNIIYLSTYQWHQQILHWLQHTSIVLRAVKQLIS